MDFTRGFKFLHGEESRGVGTLETLCQFSENSAAGAKTSVIPESRVEEISRSLEYTVRKKEWTARPRTYFILWQLNKLEAMEAFIAQGLNDTSLPFKRRKSLPDILDLSKKDEFLKWQHVVFSDVLHLERGTHVRIAEGDKLFEVGRKKLGVGSQG